MSEEKTTFQAKWANYWYYYKWHTLGAIFVLLLAAVTIVQCTTTVKPDVTIVMATADMVSLEPISMNEYFGDRITDVNGDGENNIGLTQLYITEAAESEQEIASVQKLDLELAAGGASLFLFDKVNLDRFQTRDCFETLETFLDLSAIPEDKIIRKNGVPIAVSLKGSQKLAEMGVTNDDLYVAFMFVRDKDKEDEKRMQQFDNAKAIAEALIQ